VNPATLLRVASVELSHRFGRYVDLRHYGGGLTAEAARELIAGAERELEAERESGVNGHAAAE
jgi:hypothetical protein